MGENVGDNVGDNVGENVGENIRDNVGEKICTFCRVFSCFFDPFLPLFDHKNGVF